MCALLGGRLAVLDDPAVLARLRKTASPVFAYPILAGATFRDGVWRWDGSGEAMRQQPPPPKKGEMLMMENGNFRLWRLNAGLGFVCEWSESEWRARGDHTDSPERLRSVLADFEIDGVRYVLVRSRGYPHLARRFAEILGGRLAEPESPELRRKIAAALGKYSAESAFLGGIWKLGEYSWLGSGHPIKGPLQLCGSNTDNALSLAAPSLINGELRAGQVQQMFLMELPARPGSRR